jgi:hypothetical protein
MGTLTITVNDLKSLATELDSLYDGNLEKAVERFDELLFMLFYVDQDVICFQRLQDTAYELKAIRDALKSSDAQLKAKAVEFVPLGMMGQA